MPAAGDQRADLLSLESEVWRDGQQRSQTVEATGRRESEAEARGGGVDVRQSRAERCGPKKLVRVVASAIFRLGTKLGECGFGGGSYAIYHCVSCLGLARIHSR